MEGGGRCLTDQRPAHLRAEIVSPVLTYDDIPQLQELVRAVRRAKCQVDDRCGIHIHVDGAIFDAKKLTNLAKTFYKQEELILHALGVHPERQRYCRRLNDEFIRTIERRRPRTLRDLNRASYGLLLRLGMIGDEFKTARQHLLANMPGDAAFKTRAQREKHTAKRNGGLVAGETIGETAEATEVAAVESTHIGGETS